MSETRYFLQRRFTLLREILAEVEGFDYAILDSPPNVSGSTANAIVAAHRVLIPSPLDGEVLRRVDATLQLIQEIRGEVEGVTEQIHGVVTRFRKTKPELTLLQFAQQKFDLWLECRIRESSTLYTRASMRQVPAVQLGAKNSVPVVDHLALARELALV
jgi:cellulose biosynthesis protein BcsQ